MERNRERYGVVRWAMAQFENLRVVPPGNGIVHQVNIEHLARWSRAAERDGRTVAFPDSLVGMDSHTPMVNALGVFGWGVGGIEAATAMFGQPVGLPVPRVVGCRLIGAPRRGVDVHRHRAGLTQFLRGHGVLAAVVEFCGPALDRAVAARSRHDRQHGGGISAPRWDFSRWMPRRCAICAQTGRPPRMIALVERYAKAQGLWRARTSRRSRHCWNSTSARWSRRWPGRRGRRISFRLPTRRSVSAPPIPRSGAAEAAAPRSTPTTRPLQHGDIAIAAISSCTNTAIRIR